MLRQLARTAALEDAIELCQIRLKAAFGHEIESVEMKSIQRIVVVVGCQRSGTTLTGQIIGAHPNSVLLDEGDAMYRWFRAKVDAGSNESDHYQMMLSRAETKYRVAADRFTRRADKIELLSNVTTLVLKAPNLTYDFKKLGRLSVPVNVVYPVRDPRSVVASMMRLSERDFVGNQLHLIGERPWMMAVFGPEQETLASEQEPLWIRRAALWKIKSGLAPEFREAGLPVFQFRYEDLVQRKEIVGEMLSHCGLEFAEETLNPELAYVGKGPGKTDRTRPIDGDSLQSWKQYLDDAKEADVLRISNPLAESFGYM
jgi:hypothetical protein